LKTGLRERQALHKQATTKNKIKKSVDGEKNKNNINNMITKTEKETKRETPLPLQKKKSKNRKNKNRVSRSNGVCVLFT
jgi:hypothetical protein